MCTIQVNEVKKEYPLGSTLVQALKGIDLTVHSGDFTAIVGSSGSGKTTLLNIIGCVDQATSGSVRIGGRDLQALPDRAGSAAH